MTTTTDRRRSFYRWGYENEPLPPSELEWFERARALRPTRPRLRRERAVLAVRQGRRR